MMAAPNSDNGKVVSRFAGQVVTVFAFTPGLKTNL